MKELFQVKKLDRDGNETGGDGAAKAEAKLKRRTTPSRNVVKPNKLEIRTIQYQGPNAKVRQHYSKEDGDACSQADSGTRREERTSGKR